MAFKNTLIKCLIWLGFLFVNSAITTGLVYAGVRLGVIPTVLLFAAVCHAARSCCKAYDRKHAPLPSTADTGEEPKSISPADGAAAEEPVERKKTGKKPKWAKLSSSRKPRACSRSSLSRRTNRVASRRNRSFLPSRHWWSYLLHPAACSGIICNACRKVCRLQTDPSWRRLPTSERLTNALTDMWIILKNTYHGNMFLSLIDSAIPEHLRAASAATPFRIRIHIHGINENLQIRNSGHEHVCEKQCIGMCSLARKAPHRRGAGLCLIAAAQAPPATRRHRRRLACASRRGG